MKLIFADDSRQRIASRRGMGPLVAIGGFLIEDTHVKPAEDKMDQICQRYGFPRGQEFKWSPNRNLWMHSNLVGENRQNFYLEIISILAFLNVQALVMIADTNYCRATWSMTSEFDVTLMFLERVSKSVSIEDPGLVIADRPGGDRTDEDKFVARCLDELKQSNNFAQPKTLSLIITASSKLSRLLQAADLVTGATLSFVAGEKAHSPPIFDKIKPLLRKNMARTAGFGMKLHPDLKYVNLYHWLLGDDTFWKGSWGQSLPIEKFPYFKSPDTP